MRRGLWRSAPRCKHWNSAPLNSGNLSQVIPGTPHDIRKVLELSPHLSTKKIIYRIKKKTIELFHHDSAGFFLTPLRVQQASTQSCYEWGSPAPKTRRNW